MFVELLLLVFLELEFCLLLEELALCLVTFVTRSLDEEDFVELLFEEQPANPNVSASINELDKIRCRIFFIT